MPDLQHTFASLLAMEGVELMSIRPRSSSCPSATLGEGFVSPAAFDAVVAALPEYLQDAARFTCPSGWRRGEVATVA